MDTGTHLLMGLGLGGLALNDPQLAAHTAGPWAVVVGTVLGSQAPDADSVFRLKSYSFHLRHHRGISHSIPFWFIWTALITALVAALFPDIPWTRVAPWIFLSVVLHVVTDLFNPYGTQGFWPFSRKWIAWNVIHIIDPVIFLSHLAAIALWALGLARPGPLFALLYAGLIVYFAWRTVEHRIISRRLPELDPGHRQEHRYALLPTLSLWRWNVVRESPDGEYAIGEYTWRNGLKWHQRLKSDAGPAVEAASRHPDVQTLLKLTPFACVQVHPKPWGFEVWWIDLRFPFRERYPFAAIVMLNRQGETLRSFVGWPSEKRLGADGG